MELAAGTLVTENVRLIAPLGEGGMGSVWAADHYGLRTRVAVKFIAQELLDDDPDMVKRFRREAGAAARIKSPHVVQTLDHGVMGDGTPYIVMELLEGESLAQRLERIGTLPLQQVADITAQVARGLGKAHGAGIVHRDIKPDNVFLVGSDEDELFVKLLDFGVAKHTGVQSYSVVTGTGAMIGTPGYMSPEQVLMGKHVDHRSDLWSLAVVVYHAIVGDIPFQGETFGALCVSITRGEHVPPSLKRPGVPASVDAWMARALALDPAARFQSAKELAATLREAMRGAPPEDAVPTVKRPLALHHGAHGTVVAHDTVVTQETQVTQGTVVIPTPPALEAPTLVVAEAPWRTLQSAVPRHERETSRARWLVVGVVMLLGFLSGFVVVLLTRAKPLHASRLPIPIVDPPKPIETQAAVEETAPPPPPTTTTSAVANARPLPAPPPRPEPKASPPAPDLQQKDRGF